MKIVLDLQACQAPGSSTRGIGRYSFSLAEAMLRAGRGHEYTLVGNDAFPDAMNLIRQRFEGLIDPRNIRSFTTVGPSAFNNPANHFRRIASELLREKFLSDFEPDFVHVSSLFEGAHDNAITSVDSFQKTGHTGVTLYDLIPLLKPDIYLADMQIKRWYMSKVGMLRRADLLFAISNATKNEALDALNIREDRVVNISSAADAVFQPVHYGFDASAAILARHGLGRHFIMYTGGIDGRKNIESLIRSYARLPLHIRSKYNLAIVCSVGDNDRERLTQLASSEGLSKTSLVLTGYVTEADLVALYNLCSLFVFPSLHEGFGLPVLEAMACGAPAIGSNNSSIPEVLGLKDALFDPYDQDSITAKLVEVLTDQEFSQRLRDHGLERAKAFSWQASANRTIDAIEEAVERRSSRPLQTPTVTIKPILALVSPLPPAKSGIADYTAKLLPFLHEHYDIEVVTDHPIVDDWIWSNCNIVSPDEFEERDDQNIYDRILYQMGNSDFHEYMFDLLERRPGTVVLHDYFLSGIESWREHHFGKKNHFTQQLVHAHGYKALIEHKNGNDNFALWNYPVNKHVADNAFGIIVHSDFAKRALCQDYGFASEAQARKIPIAQSVVASDRAAARQRLSFRLDDFIVCCFGFLGQTKLNHIALEGFIFSALCEKPNCKLVFVGEGSGEYYLSLLETISRSNAHDRIFITGFASNSDYSDYLAAADVGLQLRSMSRGETSAAILDCAAHEVAVVANAHGTFAELDPGSVFLLPDAVTVRDVTAALETLYSDRPTLKRYTARFTERLREYHAPDLIARQYFDAIESFWNKNALYKEKLVPATLRKTQFNEQASLADISKISDALVSNRLRAEKPKLYVDISELVRKDWGSGIQKVVKSILRSLVLQYSDDYYIEPIYFRDTEGGDLYFSAKRFSFAFFGELDIPVVDNVVEPGSGDIFLGIDLDYFGPVVCSDRGIYSRWKARGVKLYFVVYDIFPLSAPHFFEGDSYQPFYRWLTSICESADGIACISNAVESELAEWLQGADLQRQTPLAIGHFHLGTDLRPNSSTERKPLPDLDALDTTFKTLLVVGTIEPRKGYAEILDVVDLLWSEGENFNLVIVGKQGWLCGDLAERMYAHREKGKRLFWLEEVVGDVIFDVFSACDGLIAASFAEGFGLPVIEAAAFKMPLFLRDIPVFREVAREHASYFSGSIRDIADSLKRWIGEIESNLAPDSGEIEALTWDQSASQLMSLMQDATWTSEWNYSDSFRRVRAADNRFNTSVGVKRRGCIESLDNDGVIIYGPYIPLKSGRYKICILGALSLDLLSSATIEIAARQGNEVLAKQKIYGPLDAAGKFFIFDDLVLRDDVKDFELRVEIQGGSKVRISEVTITRIVSCAIPSDADADSFRIPKTQEI